MGTNYFYARVSTKGQKVDSQVSAARRLGVKSENIFVEKASGVRHDRPVLAKLLDKLQRGDTLACFKLDRIGRSLPHVAKLLADLEARGVAFVTSEDNLSTKGSTGKLLVGIMASVAQFERDLILERTNAGLRAARENGKRLGPPVKWNPDMAAKARRLMENDGLNADEVAAMFKVSRRTLFRGLKAARDHDAIVSAE